MNQSTAEYRLKIESDRRRESLETGYNSVRIKARYYASARTVGGTNRRAGKQL